MKKILSFIILYIPWTLSFTLLPFSNICIIPFLVFFIFISLLYYFFINLFIFKQINYSIHDFLLSIIILYILN